MIPHQLPGVTDALVAAAPAVANHLWQSTLFALVAAGLALALRKNQARTRHWIWMAASLKFMVPLAVLVAIGSHLAKPRAAASTQPVVYMAMEDVSEPFVLPPAPIAAPIAAKADRIDIKQLAFLIGGAVWFSGVFAVLAVWCVRWRRIAAAMREAVRVREGREFDALRRLERAAGVRTRIQLLLSPAAMEPGIFGIARPVLAWPAGISARLDDAQLDAVLAHEISHVRRRDNLTAAIHMLVEALFWFHPLVWWMGVRLVEERERACDEEVLTLCRRPEVYAESILKVCEFCVESPLACVSGVTGADLKKRIVQIMTERVVRKLDFGRKVLLVVVGLAVIAVPIVLGEVKAAQRMMVAALASAPAPFRTAANAMIAGIETPASGEIASIQPEAQGTATFGPLPADATSPAFEVASIRPTSKGNDGSMGFDLTPSGRVKIMRETVKGMIYFAYLPNIGSGLVDGGPDWAGSDEFDINAKVDDAEVATWEKLSDRQRQDRIRPMVRTLLAERFHLKLHTETQVKPVFALVQAKDGAKLKAVEPPPPHLDPQALADWAKSEHPPGLPGSFQLSGDTWSGNAIQIGMLMGEIAGNARVDRLVVDETGMTGYYDFTFKQSRDKDAPILLDQIEEQLGLKLKPRKLPVKIYVIDSVEKPSVDGAEVAPSAMPNAGGTSSADAPYVPTMMFDVASVRVSPQDPNQPHMVGGSFLPHSTNLRLQNVQLYYMVTMAYGIDDHQIEGLPDWGWTSFNIQAKSDSAADDRLAKLDKKSATLEQEHMLQTLLAERFHLQVHWTTVEGPTYNLVLAKGGSKLLPAGSMPPPPEELKWLGDHEAPPIHQQGDGRLGYEFYGHSCPMESLVQVLGEMTGRDVVDQTGLTGNFDFHFRYHDQDRRKNAMDDPTVWPPITDAVQDQLGLKLVPAKGPVRKLVIDHVEKPSEN